MVSQSKRIYLFVTPLIKFFESKKRHFLETDINEELEDHIVVIGAHRVGEPVINFLKKQKLPFRVVDLNPHTVEMLRSQDIDVVFGDISDPEIIDSLGLEKAKLIISTIITMPDNEMLLEECHRRKVQAKIVVRAADAMHAKALKDLGADYVILPETVSSHFLVSQLKTHWPNVHFSGLE
jgi:CPA2 family monovalent cation:H+ antiporter-2